MLKRDEFNSDTAFTDYLIAYYYPIIMSGYISNSTVNVFAPTILDTVFNLTIGMVNKIVKNAE